MKPAVLIGPRAAGKTSVARSLGELLGVEWVDLDDLVLERLTVDSATEAFAQLGEAAWRAAETAALERVLADPPSIIAAGGGIVCEAVNRDRLAQASHVRVIWLDVSPDVSRDRLRAGVDDRPALTGVGDAADEAVAVAVARRPWYEQVAGDRVDADGSVADVTQAVRVIMNPTVR